MAEKAENQRKITGKMTNKTARLLLVCLVALTPVSQPSLKEQGYDVIGIFVAQHDEAVTISDECPWLEDSYDAMIVAKKLMIPFRVIDLVRNTKE